MRTVRDESGKSYLLVKRSSESSLVRDPKTGEERYLENDSLDPVEGEPPLETAARRVHPPVRRILTAVPNERALGLLVELFDRGAVPARTLVSSYDLCESDLHGLLAEFRAAGLVEERKIVGERGYGLTDIAREGLELLVGDAEQ
ncbi:hypothetical protein A4G99_13440 [Haladaptatus sp. R4]|uniref:DUF7346 family protein n=1 Tax=Haladaptatus sp. R4 TaxID=1679489 RepID=UPI0007B4CE40|nr:hypothetical protein [Haladaptatus sp. R4]KZN23844.1 hypothetical protein A4G99_13440 [Haladaptatus sp. R4]